MAATEQDITEWERMARRERAEDARRRSEEQLRAIADTAVDAIISADAKGKITYVNKSAERIFGYEPMELLGRPLTLLMPHHLHAAHRRGFERFLTTRIPRVIGGTVELSGRRKDGEEFPVELALSSWSAGGETFFTGILRDITERHEAEEALRQSDELKTALLRSVSHDLRSPLTAIVAAGESIAAASLDLEARRELASVIVKEGVRLSGLVDKLLDLSRLQGGVAVPHFDSCSIEEIVQAAIEQAPESDDWVEVDLGPALPGVHADAAQLERAFANLLENARRFSGGEPVRITAEVHAGSVVTRVSDSGPGIAEADRELIFEPFFRAEEDRGSHQGSGLGLAIVKGFVEANGGRIWVDPSAEQGATFVVELPLRRSDDDTGTVQR